MVTFSTPTAARGAPDELRPDRERLLVSPKPAADVLDLLRSQDEDLLDLYRAVRLDTALTAAVLRAANSAHLGHARRVGGVRKACVMLGGSLVLSVAASRVAAFVLEPAAHEVPDWLWTHSVTVASAASVIARRADHDADEAFTAGLLHDVGLLLDATNGVPMGTSDRTHAPDGAALLDRWGLPARLVAAVQHHHDRPDGSHAPLERIVLAAHAFADELGGHGAEPTLSLAEARLLVDLTDVRPATVLGEIERELTTLTSDRVGAG